MIIIPTYNERKNIRQLVDRIRANFPAVPILFVDDNSPDGTGDEIKFIQAADSNIHVISRPAKAGFASAYLEGFQLAIQKFNPEFIVTMDADLSHTPENLVEMISLVQTGKVVVGSRYVAGGSVKNWSVRRRILSKLANFYAKFFTGLKSYDVTSGFMVIPMTQLKLISLDQIKNKGYAFLIELKAELGKLNAEFHEVPIVFHERKAGESKLERSIVLEGLKYPARLFWIRQYRENYIPWLIFLSSFIVYLFTLPHTIFFGDSPEFMASAISLGIPHPPGYPTYVLLAKVFTWLPLGSLEFRVGIFSALCASLSLTVFYYLFRKVSSNPFIGLSATWLLGFSSIFWSQAIFAKVYMALLLVILLILWLIIRFWETEQAKYLVGAMFLFGIGAGLHSMILLFLPLVIFAVVAYLMKLKNVFQTRFRYSPVIFGILFLLLGLLIYLYLPIRSHMSGKYYDFSKILHSSQPGKNFAGFVDYISRVDYNDLGGTFLLAEKITSTSAVLVHVWEQFFWLIILAPIGLWQLWRKNRKFFILTLGLFCLNILGIILLRSGTANYENDYLYSFYYLPAYVMAAFWIGWGLDGSFVLIKNKSFVKPMFYLVILILPVAMFARNIKVNNLSDFSFVDDYSRQLLNSLPPNALLLTNYEGANTDTLPFALHYQQTAKHIREDVTVLTTNDIYPQVDYKIVSFLYGLSEPKNARYYLLNYAIKSPSFQNRPIYTTYLVDNLGNAYWTEISNGLVYQFFPTRPTSLAATDHFELNYSKDLTILQSNIFGQNLLAQYFYTQASFWVQQKDLGQASRNFINGIKYDYKVGGMEQREFIYYRNKILKNL